MSLEEGRGEPREVVKTYPLNSRRLTTQVMHRIAAALGLPRASRDDVRQMVEGHLSEDRLPQNVQVDIVESEVGTTIRLRDADGVFLDVPPTSGEGEVDPTGIAESRTSPETERRRERERYRER